MNRALRMIWRTALVLIGLVGLLAAGLAAVMAWDAGFGARASDYTNTTLTAADGAELVGYLAEPDGAGPYPAVIMIHEWWGLTPAIVHKADALAREGFVVLALDTYRGATTDLIPRALFLRLTVPESRVMADLQIGFDALAARAVVDPARIAMLGYCYGGEMALRFATQNAALAATVMYYGDPITDSAEFGALAQTGGPLLGIFGAEDQQIAVEEVKAMERALTEAGIEHTVTIYPGVGHAFVQPESMAVPGPAQDAWNEAVEFLRARLMP